MLFPQAALQGKPYPIRAMIVNGGNPAVTLPDADLVRQAMKKLDFMVVSDLFMTDTAKLADIVLPAASFMEKSGVGYVYAVTTGIPYLMLRKKCVEPQGESWPDWKIWTEIGRRMGFNEFFPGTVTRRSLISSSSRPASPASSSIRSTPKACITSRRARSMRPAVPTARLRVRLSYTRRLCARTATTRFPASSNRARARSVLRTVQALPADPHHGRPYPAIYSHPVQEYPFSGQGCS